MMESCFSNKRELIILAKELGSISSTYVVVITIFYKVLRDPSPGLALADTRRGYCAYV